MVTPTPTVYVLSGVNATVEFDSTSINGQARFEYQKNQTHVKRSGNEIRVLETDFAKLVTIDVDKGDGGDATLTLLIPSLTLSKTEPHEATFDTKAILMSLRKLGSVHQQYKILNLHGTAKAIVF